MPTTIERAVCRRRTALSGRVAVASTGAAQRGALLGLRQSRGDVVAVIGRQAQGVQRALARLTGRVAEPQLERAGCWRRGWPQRAGGRAPCRRQDDAEPHLAALLDARQAHQGQEAEQRGGEEEERPWMKPQDAAPC